MRRYITSHLPVALAYGLLIAAVKGTWWPIEAAEVVSWVGWLVGVVLGVLLLYIDRVAYTYAYPEEQLSQQFTYLVRNKAYMRALSILDARRMEQVKLTFRSAMFMAVWVPLAFFALTSTSALFGKGVVMGLMLHILYDSWRLQKMNPQALTSRLFWQVKRQITDQEKMIFMYFVTAVFVFLSLWVG